MLKPQLTEFMRRMDPKSVAIIPAAREAVRSHDTNYRYRQNSDFFYLTGFEEPDAIVVIAPSEAKKFTLFVRPRDLGRLSRRRRRRDERLRRRRGLSDRGLRLKAAGDSRRTGESLLRLWSRQL